MKTINLKNNSKDQSNLNQNKLLWYLASGILLLGASLLFYLLQIQIFHKEGDTFFYLLQDIAFIPIQVLLVTVVVDKFIQRKSKQELMKKMNMVIGVFFNEMGSELIRSIAGINLNLKDILENFKIDSTWTKIDFQNGINYSNHTRHNLHLNNSELSKLKKQLNSKKDCLLRLLENPNLLEHDSFTDLLWAVYHIYDELSHRNLSKKLPLSDLVHISNDIVRAYRLLLVEWLSYMQHLQSDYPYLFSLACRTNPITNSSKEDAIVY